MFSDTPPAKGEQLPDPKDKIDVFNALLSAREESASGTKTISIEKLQKVIATDPNIIDAWTMLGNGYMRRGEPSRALEAYQRALELDPKLASARNALGVVAFARGDMVTSEREVRAALEQKADVRLAHYNLALLAERRGDLQSAITEYKRETELHPDSFKAEFNLGKLYEQLGDRQNQRAAFQRAIAANERFAEGYFYLAKLLLDEGREFDEAVRLAKKGLEVGPASEYAPLGHYVLADIYNRQGRRADAEQEAGLGRTLEARQKARSGASSLRLPHQSP